MSLAIVGGLLFVAALVLGSGATSFPAFSDDEGTYVAQAWAFLAEGSLAHYTYWYDHPPLGWLQLAVAGWLLDPILSGPAVIEGRRLMLLPALASCALLYLLARRLGLRRAFAAGAVLLFALSPLSVSYLRMVYLDNIALAWLLAAFVLAASPRARLWAYAGSGACFAIAVLSKETMLLLLPALLVLVWQGLDRRTRSFCLTAFGCVLCLLVLGYPVYALIKGELFPGPDHVSLLEAVQFQLYGRASTGSILSSNSVSRDLLDSWLALDAWLPALGLAAAPIALAMKRLRSVGVAVLLLVLMAMRPGYLPQPYVIALLPFLALAAAGTLDAGSRQVAERARAPWLRRLAVPVALVAPLLLIGPSWTGADRYAATADQTSSVMAAERWIVSEIHPKARVLVDDTMYVDLVRAGFEPRFGAVWFFKLDFTTNLDPSIAANLPQGWRAFDYVVSTRVIRSALTQNRGRLRQVRLALSNSRQVASFGSGADRVEVRRIVGVGTGSGLIPRGARRRSDRSGGARAFGESGLYPGAGSAPAVLTDNPFREARPRRPRPRRAATERRTSRARSGASRRARPSRPAVRRATPRRRALRRPPRARSGASRTSGARSGGRRRGPRSRSRSPVPRKRAQAIRRRPRAPRRARPDSSPGPRELLDAAGAVGGEVNIRGETGLMTLGDRR